MPDNDKKPTGQSPADIAREAFRRLALRRIAPTPDAYREIYNEIAGITEDDGAERVLSEFAGTVASVSDQAAAVAARLRQSLSDRNWEDCGTQLQRLVDDCLTLQSPAPLAAPATVGTAVAAPSPRSIPLVDDAPPARQLAPLAATDGENPQVQMLRDLLVRTLTLGVGALVQGVPDLAEQTEQLATAIRDAGSEAALNSASARLKQLCFRIELKSADMAEEHELLLRLFRLLLENVGELLEDDSWLAGQVAAVQALLTGPLSTAALNDAERSLKEVIYKQGLLKHSLSEAKDTVKNMMITFIDQLGVVATSAADYHEKIGLYSKQISTATDINELNRLMDNLLRDTRTAQTETLRSRDDMLAARRAVQDAEARIHELEKKLEQMSELVREDQLTGSLNRRGLDDVFEREVARAERRDSPLCVAMLDLDDFKRLNDTHGHGAGDEALIHVVRVIKQTLRSLDVVGRFGGEEFLVVLPDTPLNEATHTVTRLQRELTKRIFMYNNKRLLLTFSAGVALRRPGEDQAALVKRADAALYEAKRAGKNRVVAA